MKDDREEPPSSNTSPQMSGDVINYTHDELTCSNKKGFFKFFKSIFKKKVDSSLRETIEDYFEEEQNGDNAQTITEQEKTLISNVLDLRDLTAQDVMVPRADIFAISESTSQEELLAYLAQQQYSRLPVYRDTLDNVIGSIHIKDLLSCIAKNTEFSIRDYIREVPIISPSMRILDLLLQMRLSRKHMVLVVDEYGGIDGLITINDVLESIIGEIDDEYASEDQPTIQFMDDGSVLADARYDVDVFEEQFGLILSDEEREDNDTLGGVIFDLAGRVPARGEMISHSSGMVFEILDADPRRINRLRITNVPNSKS